MTNSDFRRSAGSDSAKLVAALQMIALSSKDGASIEIAKAAIADDTGHVDWDIMAEQRLEQRSRDAAQSSQVTEQQIEDGAKALFGEGWDKTATPANRRYCREKAKAIFAAMAAQPPAAPVETKSQLAAGTGPATRDGSSPERSIPLHGSSAGSEPVQDTWFTDSSLPIMAASGDAENDRVIKLHFRRKVTDVDRKRLIEVLNAGELSLAQPQASSADIVQHDHRVYFACECCAEHEPENGVSDRSDIAVMPDGTWLCDSCYSDCDKTAYGMVPCDVDDFEFPRFEDLPRPAPYSLPRPHGGGK